MDYEVKETQPEKDPKGMDGAIQSIMDMARSIALEEIRDYSSGIRTIIRQELRALKPEIAADVAEEIAKQIRAKQA
jgi:hypothetical protein